MPNWNRNEAADPLFVENVLRIVFPVIVMELDSSSYTSAVYPSWSITHTSKAAGTLEQRRSLCLWNKAQETGTSGNQVHDFSLIINIF